MIIVVLAVAGLAFGKQAVQGELVWQMQDMIGAQGAKVIQDLIKASHEPSSGIIATIVGLVTLFFGASSVVVELTDALNTIWHVPRNQGQSGLSSIFRFIRQRFGGQTFESTLALTLLPRPRPRAGQLHRKQALHRLYSGKKRVSPDRKD